MILYLGQFRDSLPFHDLLISQSHSAQLHLRYLHDYQYTCWSNTFPQKVDTFSEVRIPTYSPFDDDVILHTECT